MWVPGTPAADPERARAEAARRARAKVRRYCTAHRLNRLGTLTYASACHDPMQVRADVAGFFRSLRALLGGRALPYVWVPEWHKSGHGLHVHFAVGQFIGRSKIEAAWGRGFVHIKRLSDLPVGSTSLHEARRAAGYLSKYVTKAFADTEAERSLGLHRYEVAQGFQPPVVRLTGRSSREVLYQAVERMGGALPAISWSSADAEDWQGPPAVWFAWD
ncbi:rolling circle replication-associated protein [Nocardioides aquiterrae]|uniref:rolling circle replication-associated protein n=1 Tax=Nocardioides aquiterrae TaxID=203799 RepID=UPI0031E214FF